MFYKHQYKMFKLYLYFFLHTVYTTVTLNLYVKSHDGLNLHLYTSEENLHCWVIFL
jgi:hypothetical protein